ncbi:MAG: DUF2431 domain-containing protein [archaeon]|nr:DUF2431 domain-containing protein [archaeon]
MIYTPDEDSYLLEKYVKKYSKNKSFLDMGSGSGIQAKAAISAGASSVLASDINKEAVENLKSQGINAIHSNLFKNIKSKFDIIAFNPPYLPEDKQEDKESALVTTGGKKGDEIILKFLKQAKAHLNKNGTILLILSSLTPKNKIIPLLNKLSMSYKILENKKIFFESLEIWEIQ